jgi:hypothetical protein
VLCDLVEQPPGDVCRHIVGALLVGERLVGLPDSGLEPVVAEEPALWVLLFGEPVGAEHEQVARGEREPMGRVFGAIIVTPDRLARASGLCPALQTSTYPDSGR